MGSWHGTCLISDMHITYGQDVAVFMLLKNNEPKSFCDTNALYDVCPVPFYGKYDDYGGVEKCTGPGLNMVVEAIRQQLYEFGQGPNEYHDCEVTQKNFNIELMFEADGENRLGIQYNPSYYNSDEYDKSELEKINEKNPLTSSQQFELDRLATKIRKIDTFRAVTHVIIHGDIFRAIMNNWYIEEYIGENCGTHGYKNSYTRLYFKDIETSIPEYIRRMKLNIEERKQLQKELSALDEKAKLSHPSMRLFFRSMMQNDLFEYNDSCLAGRWMRSFNHSSDSVYGLINVNDCVNELSEQEQWDKLEKFVKEVLTTAWINSYMTHTRKMWVKKTGLGGQEADHTGYQILIDAMTTIMKSEKEEYDE